MSSGKWIWRSGQVAFDASRAVARTAEGRLLSWSAGRGARAARYGVVGPWDPPLPPRISGVLDYSGLARPQDIQPSRIDFPLGRYISPRGKWRPKDPFGLSTSVVNRHAVVIAPSRSGKTASVVGPWIHAAVRLGYVVVAIDVKGNNDLLSEVKQYAATQPPLGGMPVLIWDYRNPSRSVSWNWVRDLDSDGAINAAVEAICGRASDNDPNRSFHFRDMKYLRGLLELTSLSQPPMTVRGLIQTLEDQTALEALVLQHASTRGASRLRELCGHTPFDYVRAVQFVTTHLETLDTQGFVDVTSRSQFRMSALDGMSGALVIVNAPVADQSLSAAASGLFVGQLLFRRLQRFATPSSPMLLVLDEAARLQDRIDLGALMSLAAGAGVSVLLSVQDVTQFEEIRRSEILANCGTCVVLPGVSSDTSEYLGNRLGKRQRLSLSESTTHDRHSGTGTSYSRVVELAPVLEHNEISHLPFGRFSAVVHTRHLSPKPILVDLTRSDLA
jgi:type IV secretory pathway TraG/TraD family ATPase VirD4